jgi:Zn-dependent peptidase ImmA (M78 family)
MTIEEAAPSPRAMARLIHSQSGYRCGPVDIEAIAQALDILVIERKPLVGLEGILITQPERRDGAILVNSACNPRRQRFSIAHELGHFLFLSHTSGEGLFECSGQDMRTSSLDRDRHARQEAEANAFAIAVLLPQKQMDALCQNRTSLRAVVSLAAEVDVSKNAVVREYVTQSPRPLAAIFHQHGRARWNCTHKDFPHLPFHNRGLAEIMGEHTVGETTDPNLVDPLSWGHRKPVDLLAQTHYQQGGHAITLLSIKDG